MDTCEDTLEGEREAQDAKLAVRQREAESMEARVAFLRDPVALEEQVAQFERQYAELEALRMKYEEDNVSRKRAVCEEIEKACLQMKRYDDYCLKKCRGSAVSKTKTRNVWQAQTVAEYDIV